MLYTRVQIRNTNLHSQLKTFLQNGWKPAKIKIKKPLFTPEFKLGIQSYIHNRISLQNGWKTAKFYMHRDNFTHICACETPLFWTLVEPYWLRRFKVSSMNGKAGYKQLFRVLRIWYDGEEILLENPKSTLILPSLEVPACSKSMWRSAIFTKSF